MGKLIWDQIGERVYETGVNKGVLYPFNNTTKEYDKGVAWNGLTNVSENPSGAEATPLYADNIKYLNLMSAENFGATVEAYTYPDEFAECNGEVALAEGVIAGQQKRKAFGMSYQTRIGNDTDAEAGYKIHLVYGALAAPSQKSYATINDSPEAITFSWELTTTPVEVPGMKPTAIITIDSTKVNAEELADLEEILYGKAATTGENPQQAVDARLPLPTELATIFTSQAAG